MPEKTDARPWVPDTPSPDNLAGAMQECRGCELFSDATQAVPGRGTFDARLLLLGEQPGDQEDRQGAPFVGPAGRVLVDALDEAGVDRSDVYVTNTVKHFRWKASGKRRLHQSPARGHVESCRPWLDAELSLLRPEGAVLLGGTAGKALYGSTFKVGESRSVLREWPAEKYPVAAPPSWVLATIHPSAVLRADDADRRGMYDGLVADLRMAAETLQRPA
jgi:uracil-DNA glycosylase family protein